MTFDGFALHPTLLRGLAALGFSAPTAIQAELIPAGLEGRDIVGLAPTGTGKTLAYLLPVAHRLIVEPPPILKGPRRRGGGRRSGRVDPRSRLRALVLCPTRELAQQVAKDAYAVTKGSLLHVAAVWGKSPLAPQKALIEKGTDVLVGTPGRVRELLELDALSLANVRHVVVDESDRMLDLGFLPQVDAILARMPPDRQVMFLSATYPPVVRELMDRYLRDPKRVEAGAHTRPAEHVKQTLYRVDDLQKTATVLALVAGEKRRGVIVFVRTRRRAGWIATALVKNGVPAAVLHGDRSQAQREKALADFADGTAHVLVATDVASRGLHIPRTRTVINYDVPMMPEDYVHRIGRAGHGGGFAESFTLLALDPEEKERWKRVTRLADIDLVVTATPDVSRWMRPEDHEKVMRLAKRREAQARVRAETARARVAEEREREAERERRVHGDLREKTTKRAGKSSVRLRGGGGTKRVDPKQRPGRGVKRASGG